MKTRNLIAIVAMLVAVVMGGCKKDDDPAVRPRVISTNPISSATGVVLNGKVSAKFSAALSIASVTSETFSLQQGTTAVAGTVSAADSTALFSPSANLLPNTTYTATLKTGVKDAAGTTLASNYVWTFTTGAAPDVTKPTATLTDPLNNATGVTLDHLVVVTFSEAMDATSITPVTFTLKQGTTAVAGAVTYAASKATFTPSSALASNTVYTATITTGAKDLAGNTIAANYVFSFTTKDTSLPTVNATDPLNNATGVATNKAVTLTFSKPMDPSTITTSTFLLKQGTTAVAGTVSYSGNTAKFTPSALLSASLVYSATVTTGAKDLSGNALAANIVWSFTTGTSASAAQAVVNLGSSINYVILAKTAINNNPTSAITGDMGLSPAAESFITGFSLTDATGYATSPQVTGKIYAADQASPTPINLTTAVADMITAYNDASGRPSPDFSELGTGNIGGQTLGAGLYKWTNTVTLPSDVTISGGANDVWIFQIAGDLTVSNAVNITLIGGAQAKNIFWQVAGTVSVGTTSHFEGIILSKTGVTFKTGASMNGRALAQTAVILDSNAITKPQ